MKLNEMTRAQRWYVQNSIQAIAGPQAQQMVGNDIQSFSTQDEAIKNLIIQLCQFFKDATEEDDDNWISDEAEAWCHATVQDIKTSNDLWSYHQEKTDDSIHYYYSVGDGDFILSYGKPLMPNDEEVQQYYKQHGIIK